MKEITEDYVSFETAKLLKEKGFDEKCFQYWHEKDNELVHSQSPHPIRNITNPCFFGPAAPTLQMAMKWLREKDIIITIVYARCSMQTIGSQMMFGFNIQNTQGELLSENTDVAYDSYEQAGMAAIKYSLENLI